MRSLEGAVVAVTGANGGLGTQFVHQALDRGAAKVYATARTPRSWNDDRVVPLQLDITDPTSIAIAASSANDTTVLINNAGIGVGAPSLLLTALEDFRRSFETNAIGLLAVTQAFAPSLRATRGAIINVASVASWRAPGRVAAYGATKAAVWSLTNSLRTELQPDDVQVLGLYLSFTDTPMASAVDAPKSDPADVVRQAYDGLEADQLEVLADDLTRQVRAELSGMIASV